MKQTRGASGTRGKGRNFIKVGTVKVFHYRAGDGRTFIDARPYGRKLVSKKDREEALREARRIAVEINQGGVEVLALTPEDRAVYAKAKATAAELGTDLVSACTLLRDAHRLLETIPGIGKATLLDAVRAGCTALSRPVHLTTDVIGELLNSKAASDLDGRYERDLKHQLRDFAAAFPGDIAAIGAAEIETWLNARKRADGKPLSAKRRNHVHANLTMLFKFARARGYLPDEITAAHKIEKQTIRRGKIGIFNPREIQALLEQVEHRWLPYFAIAAFTGVRCEEISLSYHAADRKDVLRWEDFDWQNREICIREEVAKTGHARRCPMSDNLFGWLSPWREAETRGHVVTGSLQKAMKRLKKKLTELAAESDAVPKTLVEKWPHNVLRHSYGSYEMARCGNMQQLSYWMGDSVDMIKRHYHNPRPRSEAEAWFAVFPGTANNVIQLTLPGVRA